MDSRCKNRTYDDGICILIGKAGCHLILMQPEAKAKHGKSITSLLCICLASPEQLMAWAEVYIMMFTLPRGTFE